MQWSHAQASTYKVALTRGVMAMAAAMVIESLLACLLSPNHPFKKHQTSLTKRYS